MTLGDFLNCDERADAGIYEEYVQPSEALANLVHERLYLLQIRDVGAHAHGAGSNMFNRAMESLFASAGNDHTRANTAADASPIPLFPPITTATCR